ncbi:membrane protein insertion efficiency factor YidD [Vagococcus coleopterorum]|uniref:Putative membrane protein insertion efficiency factor n=1 Tax=Vagococcus coleopterorum TaxID=2714946 RepID=A0A6G8ANX0_9ENTE|nr:membrane protein insertion efficiency factor YidD [Vagococcus coleopterorum]QIL46670.1 membrane protein insertion efficiency factor YidD [Vagococcus coleopterorum]
MKRLILAIVGFYQRKISPGLPRRCRYHPTCSQYMVDAVNYHGGFKGFIMGIARIFRCQPLVKGGIDYAPLKFTVRRNSDEVYPGPYKKECQCHDEIN